jgi:hypothetical protein
LSARWEQLRSIAGRSSFSTGDLLLILWFSVNTGVLLAPFIRYPWVLGGDAVLYSQAAGLLLAGQDPWSPLPNSVVSLWSHPHLLLFYAPFAGLPPIVTGLTWAFGLLALSAVALRRLGLPLWWLAFPPLVDAIRWGSSDALVFAILVLGARWLAPIAKPYAAFPLLGDARWRDIAIALAIALATAFFLPWQLFLSHLPGIIAEARVNTNDLSTFGQPLAMVVAIIALAALGWRRAFWLATPVLWPLTQFHYAAMTIPALTRSAAFFFAVPIPGAPLLGVIVAAILARFAPSLDPPVVRPAGAPGSPPTP